MSALSTAFISELSADDLANLAEKLRPYLRSTEAEPNPWLNVEQAAEYLTCPKSRLYALVSARRVPFHKDGSRTLFRRDELDEWIRKGGARRP